MKSTLDVKKKNAYINTLGYFLIIIFSLTLAFPWAFMRYHSWLIKNTKLNGKKLVFDGKTKHLYLIYLSGVLFAVITFLTFTFITALIAVLLERNGYKNDWFKSRVFKFYGTVPTLFFAIFITSRFYKYRNNHTHYDGYSNTKSGIKIQLYKIILSSIIFKVIILATSFIGYPFALNIRERFLQSRRYIDGDDLKFKGSIGKICLIWFSGIFLTIITIFLYFPYLFFLLNKYIITNTILKNNGLNEECLE